MGVVRDCRDKRLEEGGSSGHAGALEPLDEGGLRGAVYSREQVELAFSGSHLGDVRDGRSRSSSCGTSFWMACSRLPRAGSRCRGAQGSGEAKSESARDRGLERIKAAIQRQQRVTSTAPCSRERTVERACSVRSCSQPRSCAGATWLWSSGSLHSGAPRQACERRRPATLLPASLRTPSSSPSASLLHANSLYVLLIAPLTPLGKNAPDVTPAPVLL